MNLAECGGCVQFADNILSEFFEKFLEKFFAVGKFSLIAAFIAIAVSFYGNRTESFVKAIQLVVSIVGIGVYVVLIIYRLRSIISIHL